MNSNIFWNDFGANNFLNFPFGFQDEFLKMICNELFEKAIKDLKL